MPAEDPPLVQPFEDETKAELAQAVSRSALAQTAQVTPAHGSLVHFICENGRCMGILSALFQIPVVGELNLSEIMSHFTHGMLTCTEGPEARIKTDCSWKCVACLASASVSLSEEGTSPHVAHWCKMLCKNTVQFASGTKKGAEKCFRTRLLSLRGEAAPVVLTEDYQR